MCDQESNEFLSSKVDELISLMLEATGSCHFSAKRHRLDSLYYLIVYVSKVSTVISHGLGTKIYELVCILYK